MPNNLSIYQRRIIILPKHGTVHGQGDERIMILGMRTFTFVRVEFDRDRSRLLAAITLQISMLFNAKFPKGSE